MNCSHCFISISLLQQTVWKKINIFVENWRVFVPERIRPLWFESWRFVTNLLSKHHNASMQQGGVTNQCFSRETVIWADFASEILSVPDAFFVLPSNGISAWNLWTDCGRLKHVFFQKKIPPQTSHSIKMTPQEHPKLTQYCDSRLSSTVHGTALE